MTDKVKNIWDTACEVFEADRELVHSRKLEQVFAKQAVWMLLKDRGWYDREIAKEFGLERSTVCNGRRRGEEGLKYVRGYREKFIKIKSKLIEK